MLFSRCDVIDSVARPTIGLQFACSNLCCFHAFVDLRSDFVVRGVPRTETYVDEILFHCFEFKVESEVIREVHAVVCKEVGDALVR